MSVRVLLSCPLGHWHDPTVWWSVIIKAVLHHCTGGVAFRKVVNCRMLKMCVSALKSEGWNFAKFGKVKKNTLYVYFMTRQGVARLIALFCCNFFLIFLRTLLENHAKWRMLYMSHMVW